jgi:hypothetical protein
LLRKLKGLMNHMRCAILTVTLWTGLALTFARAEGKPKIEFDSTLYDFGTTSRVQQVAGALTFQNTGNGDLQLTNLSATCVCIRAGAEPTRLKPGESGMIDFSINIGPSVGDIVEQVFVSSNDPQNPTVTLTIHLYIKPLFEVTPTAVQLGSLRPGNTTNLTVAVKRTDGRKLRITKVVSDNPSLTTRVMPVKESRGQAARILIQFKAGDHPGRFEETLQVHTGEMYAEDIPKPSFEISLQGRVIGAVH